MDAKSAINGDVFFHFFFRLHGCVYKRTPERENLMFQSRRRPRAISVIAAAAALGSEMLGFAPPPPLGSRGFDLI